MVLARLVCPPYAIKTAAALKTIAVINVEGIGRALEGFLRNREPNVVKRCVRRRTEGIRFGSLDCRRSLRIANVSA